MSGILQAGEGRASGLIKAAGGSGSTVTWQTGDIKTGDFTAVANQGFFVNTTSSAITATLPAGAAGVVIAFQDYNNTFDSNILTISPNGSEKVNGSAGDIQLGTEGQGVHLVYIDGTVGWRVVIGSDDPFANVGSNFIQASGGTETTCGNFKTHTFTGPGTFAVTNIGLGTKCNPSIMDYLVVAGGGSGGSDNGKGSGGGGGGGFREAKAACSPVHTQPPHTASPLASTTGITATLANFPITIGAGGAGVVPCSQPGINGNQGSDSIFTTITSTGGGYGGSGTGCGQTGGDGGSGGGGGGGPNNRQGGDGNTPPVSPAQGQNGGNSSAPSPSPLQGGGGGGASEVGDAGQGPNPHQGGRGGAGTETALAPSAVGGPGSNPTLRDFSGGGGAGKSQQGANTQGPGSPCGTGGAGAGNPGIGGSGPSNSGGGGGAGGDSSPRLSGTGGSGAVVIRYKYQ